MNDFVRNIRCFDILCAVREMSPGRNVNWSNSIAFIFSRLIFDTDLVFEIFGFGFFIYF